MTIDSLAAAMEASEDRIGDSDGPDADEADRLREFNEELERAINEEFGQVPF